MEENNKKDFDPKVFGEMITGLAASFDRENAEKYPEVLKEFDERLLLYTRNSEEPLKKLKEYPDVSRGIKLGVMSAIRNRFAEQLGVNRNSLTEQNKRIYTTMLYEDLEKFFDEYFVANEGHACSHDKTSFVMGRLAKAVIENVDDVTFESTYADAGRPDMDEEGKIPYWCPKTLSSVTEAYELYRKYKRVKGEVIIQKAVLEKLYEAIERNE